jgi:hypothetical protein
MAANIRKALASVAVSLFLAGTLAPAASASPGAVIRDCSEDGVLNGHYSHGDLTKALDQLPSDLDEYTDCRAVIRSAQLGSAAPKHRGGRGRGIAGKVDAGAPPRPDEQRKIAQATGAGGGPVKIGGKGIRPGASGAPFKTAGFGTDLPTLVLVVLIALGAMVLGAGALAVQRHRPALVRVGGSRLAEPFTRAARAVRNGISRLRR